MRRIWLLFLFLIVFSICSCQRKKEVAKEKSRALELCFKEKIISLDPRFGTSRPSSLVIKMLFEGLMRLDSNGNLVPGLAEEYEISEDRKTYIFYIRNCHWSNGDPITAYDVEFSWKRAIDPRSAKTSSYLFCPIKNASSCFEGKSKIEEVGIKALNDRILVVNLEHPAPYFLELTTTSSFSPIPKRVALEHKNWATHKIDDFVSSGPFRLRSWKRGQQLTMDRNPFYWNADGVKIPKIDIKIFPDEQDQVRLFRAKQIDWLGQPLAIFSSEIFEGLKNVDYQTSSSLLACFCNVNSYPLNNKNLRKALAFGINRKAIAEHLFHQGGMSAQTLLNPLLTDRNQEGYFHDNDCIKAALHLRVALNELGMNLGDLPEMTLSYPNTPLQSRVAHEIQRQWEKNLGISVKLDPFDSPRFFDHVTKGNHQIASSIWEGLLLNPIHMLETMGSTLGKNILTNWHSFEFSKIVDRLRIETDVKKTEKLIREAESYLIEEMPIIPICFSSVYFSKNQRLKNVYISPVSHVDFTYAYFQENDESRSEVR